DGPRRPAGHGVLPGDPAAAGPGAGRRLAAVVLAQPRRPGDHLVRLRAGLDHAAVDHLLQGQARAESGDQRAGGGGHHHRLGLHVRRRALSEPPADVVSEHGGNPQALENQYGKPAQGWLDLSTGINPDGYPIGTLEADDWRMLPTGATLSALRE